MAGLNAEELNKYWVRFSGLNPYGQCPSMATVHLLK